MDMTKSNQADDAEREARIADRFARDEATGVSPLIACLDEFKPPFTVIEPAVQSLPVVLSSPHSGRNYPNAFLEASSLSAREIRRSEDSFVDEILATTPGQGAPLICAEFPRAFCDLNREAYELDPTMFVDDLPHFANVHSLRVISGLGTIARVVSDGAEIYRDKLRFADALERVEQLYRPYHAALKSMIETTRDRFGACLLLDCHSMPSKFATERWTGGPPKVDVILGDRFGTSCSPHIVAHVERELAHRGYSAARNDPFAGGYCTEHYGDPKKNVHALQIEINRALYMDEESLERRSGLKSLCEDMKEIVASFEELDLSLFR